VIDIVIELLHHLCLLAHLLPEVFILVLEHLRNRQDLIQVAVLPIDVLLLQLD